MNIPPPPYDYFLAALSGAHKAAANWTEKAFRRATRRSSLLIYLGIFAVLSLIATLTIGWTVNTLPAAPPIQAFGPPAVVLLTADGAPFARRGELRERPVDSAQLPDHVVRPFVEIEDRRFYEHHGVDLRGLLRAAAANARAGKIVQGGSTITQQLVKNTMLGSERTFTRKLREAVAAVSLEYRLPKDEILSRYLSTAYFGDGVYGLGSASRQYFDKPPEDLTVGEAAMLAGVIKAPSQLAPSRHPEAAIARQRVVLEALVRARALTPAEAAAAVATTAPLPSSKMSSFGGYFADWLYPKVATDLAPAFGEIAVPTTLDGRLQQHAEALIAKALRDGRASGGPSQAALVAMRVDGTVVAMVGGSDYDSSQFNRAVSARRQPGSTFKLFAYLAAFRHGADPYSVVSDGPISIGSWTPANADRQSHGLMTLETAFANSSNLAAVRISQAVGLDAVIEAARDLGLTTPLDNVPSLPLGTSGVSLLELTGAYAAVAAGEYPVRPAGLPASRSDPAFTRPLDWEREQRPLLQILQAAAERGTGRNAALPIAAYGKTGTSQNNRDAMFVGFAGDLVVGVWVGNDDETPMRAISGGALPARIWRAFMETALHDEIARARASIEPSVAPLAPPEDAAPSWFERLRSIFGA